MRAINENNVLLKESNNKIDTLFSTLRRNKYLTEKDFYLFVFSLSGLLENIKLNNNDLIFENNNQLLNLTKKEFYLNWMDDSIENLSNIDKNSNYNNSDE